MLHDLSYDSGDPMFSYNGLRFGVQVFTFENVYGLDRDRCVVKEEPDTGFRITCDELTWAGRQMRAAGRVVLEAGTVARGTVIRIAARAERMIRCVKLILKGIPDGVIVNSRDCPQKSIPDSGLALMYPEGWRMMSTPLVVLRTAAGDLLYFRSLDTRVREKRFCFFRRGGALDVELIFEENATEMQNSVTVPGWEIGRCSTLEEIYREQMSFIESCYTLGSWEERPDVPAWAREIALVAAIHCQHWTGYVFNDYDKVLQTIEWLARWIEPYRLLAYLPGWEGRYYWQYGEYRPDERMGGAEGFARLVNGAKAMGAHVMPMFGINYANRGIENFEAWGAPSEFRSAGGNRFGGSVDWDGSRHYDHGSNANLNPAAPMWQTRLVSQITDLIDRYGFDGVFLDIAAVWVNDPNHYLYDGLVKLAARLKENRPNLLLAGEGWYDAISALIPLVQSGHTDGVLHWHDQPVAEFFTKYNRCFAHLCLGDHGRGSTGVHEIGHNPIVRLPQRRGIIPTVTVVEDTLAKASDKVLEIIEEAKRYASLYLTAGGDK